MDTVKSGIEAKLADQGISTLVVDLFRLDGGAMFGSVPKVVWEKRIEADSLNRIPLASRVLVVEHAGRKVLVDAGMGSMWSQDMLQRFEIVPQYKQKISELLPGISDVVTTHLHFDHIGGLSYSENNQVLPVFPGLTHYISSVNQKESCAPNSRERGSFLKHHLEFLDVVPIVPVANGDVVLDCIRFVECHGHSAGMMVVEVLMGESIACAFVADLVPTEHHIRLPYIMGYDQSARQSIEEKERLLGKYADLETPIIFQHSRTMSAAVIHREGKDFSIKTVLDLDRVVGS